MPNKTTTAAATSRRTSRLRGATAITALQFEIRLREAEASLPRPNGAGKSTIAVCCSASFTRAAGGARCWAATYRDSVAILAGRGYLPVHRAVLPVVAGARFLARLVGPAAPLRGSSSTGWSSRADAAPAGARLSRGIARRSASSIAAAHAPELALLGLADLVPRPADARSFRLPTDGVQRAHDDLLIVARAVLVERVCDRVAHRNGEAPGRPRSRPAGAHAVGG